MKKTKSNPDPDLLRVLILEDNSADAELVERELRQAGINFTSRLVEGKRKYSKALADFQPQVILSDFKLPDFDGLAALEITRRLAPDTPFIFVSGSIGEEQAIETLALGAADYILKDNLQRLGPAVKRVVETVRLELEKKKSDEELRRHVDELRLLAEAADRFVHINDLDEVYTYLAQTIPAISGADYLMLSLYDEKQQAMRPKIVTGFEPFRETIHRRFHIDPLQMVFYLKDMRPDDFSDFISRKLLPVRDGFYGLSNRKIPRLICRAIEKLLRVDAMFSMGFSWENQLYGGLTVLFKKGNELKNHAQIEALLNQAAVSIKRLLAEKFLRASEEQLRQSEEYYRILVDTSPDAIIIIDGGGRITFASQKAIEFFGVPSQTTLKGIPLLDFVEPEDVPIMQKRLVEILSGRALPETSEYRLLRHDLRPFWGEVSSAPLQDAAGRNIGLLLICRDVSERKLAEEQIRASLKEKEVLLQEIHHRVKNNLQIISGLLTLQADQAAGKSLEEIFQESQDRIRSIALIHEKLYRSHNLAEIAFDEYLRALTENLFISQGVVAGRITVKYEMEPIQFTIEKAIPLGLIVNELITNALKYAFPAGRQGEIRIGLRGYKGEKSYALKTDSGTLHVVPTCELIVADNGVGLPAGFKPDTQKSLGMKLVSMLARQIQAELKVKTAPGTEFRLLFPGHPANQDIKDKNHGG